MDTQEVFDNIKSSLVTPEIRHLITRTAVYLFSNQHVQEKLLTSGIGWLTSTYASGAVLLYLL